MASRTRHKCKKFVFGRNRQEPSFCVSQGWSAVGRVQGGEDARTFSVSL